MFNKILLFIVILVALSVVGLSVSPMSDGFSHNLPDGSCVSSVVKMLPCSKDGFQADILSGLFLFLAFPFFGLIASSFGLILLSFSSWRIFYRHSFFYKIKANRWLALLENSPSFV